MYRDKIKGKSNIASIVELFLMFLLLLVVIVVITLVCMTTRSGMARSSAGMSRPRRRAEARVKPGFPKSGSSRSGGTKLFR